jgi:tRNA pseudouridine38-40 synthase
MPKLVVSLSFVGTQYHGWARQPNATSVQAIIEEALSSLLRTPTTVVGAGRTDAGVHARHLPFHFQVEQTDLSPELITYRLNRMLPKDMGVLGTYEAPEAFHARFSAFKRTYTYRFGLQKNPFVQPFVWDVFRPPQWDVMQEAASLLPNYTSFGAFCRSHADSTTMECKNLQVQWEFRPDMVLLTLSANRFLRNMVRAIVGTLIDVGKGKIDLHTFQHIIEQGDRKLAGASAPASGLTLERVDYPLRFTEHWQGFYPNEGMAL